MNSLRVNSTIEPIQLLPKLQTRKCSISTTSLDNLYEKKRNTKEQNKTLKFLQHGTQEYKIILDRVKDKRPANILQEEKKRENAQLENKHSKSRTRIELDYLDDHKDKKKIDSLLQNRVKASITHTSSPYCREKAEEYYKLMRKQDKKTKLQAALKKYQETIGAEKAPERLERLLNEYDEEQAQLRNRTSCVPIMLRKLEKLKQAGCYRFIDIFHILDDNEDGILTLKEIIDAMNSFNLDMTLEDAKDFMSTLDPRGNGYVKFSELKLCMKNFHRQNITI